MCQFANVGTPLARWQSATYSQAFDVTVICLHLVRADIAVAALIGSRSRLESITLTLMAESSQFTELVGVIWIYIAKT